MPERTLEKGLPQIAKSRYKMPSVVTVVGKSKSGKTTVVERQVQEFSVVFFLTIRVGILK